MSLDKIDQYIRELWAIRDYPKVSNELLERTKECLALVQLYLDKREAWENERIELELEFEIAKEQRDELMWKYESRI